MATIRVLLAGNRAKLRRLWHAALDQTPDVQIVDEATNGKELRQQLARTDFDLVLVDVHLPHVQGQDMPSWVAKRNPQVVTLTWGVCADQTTIFVAGRCANDRLPVTGVGIHSAVELMRWLVNEKNCEPHPG